MSRSGAGTQAKLTELSKPTFFVSLASSAGNEQTHNARHLKRRSPPPARCRRPDCRNR
ncbi:glycosyltransferase [Streptomyces sp. NPDC055966]|uniref:glycosyltransferase n=1 Tax=Streptomyces sp. NPDC055966 TaxID=3345669 RepID=UPI0035DA4CE0